MTKPIRRRRDVERERRQERLPASAPLQPIETKREIIGGRAVEVRVYPPGPSRWEGSSSTSCAHPVFGEGRIAKRRGHS